MKQMILMRGIPGSGKSTKAKELVGSGEIFSTDQFFMHGNDYVFEPSKIGIAHAWNKRRAQEAINKHVSPIIIDNTNVKLFEMKDYVKMATAAGYTVSIAEPDTEWWKKFKKDMTPEEKAILADDLASRNIHRVPREVILKMMDNWAFDVKIEELAS